MKFNSDGKFKIMQITDMQEIPAISADTLNLLEAAVEAEKPDLVVYTGDQIKGYGVTYKGKGKELERAVAKTNLYSDAEQIFILCRHWNSVLFLQQLGCLSYLVFISPFLYLVNNA